MKDPEFGEARSKAHGEMSLRQKAKAAFTVKKALAGAGLALCLVAVIFAIGLLASQCDNLIRSHKEKASTNKEASEAKPQLNRRSESSSEVEFVSVPISTRTALSTIYSISSPSGDTTLTQTTTKTTSVVLSSGAPICSNWNATLTVTVTVLPTPSAPASSSLPSVPSSVLGDATATGAASTVTNINTDVSYTSGPSDATVSGNPSTVTNVQTDVSLTSGLPDVTVSGNPSTITNLQTDFSLTTGLPDATVPGDPSTVTDVQPSTLLTSNPSTDPSTSVVIVVISDLWSSSATFPAVPTLVTVTAISTVKATVTTINSSPVVVTVTDAYPAPGPSSTAASSANGEAGATTLTTTQSTATQFVTTTGGQPVTSTTTVFVPSASYPGANNSSVSGIPAGTATSIGVPATPIVVSRGNKELEPPHAWAFSSLGYVIMLVAAIMFML